MVFGKRLNRNQQRRPMDKTAIAYLYLSLPEDHLLHISKYKTAKAVRNVLKIRHVGVNCLQQAKQ
ncbi:LOW QUALITY PROTEIN: hypothetical protein OSB04_002135 [Centaurea solstitialis]|uniref:Uncharacterized protein n=1 Tax=Centaurea solstitialis TaxID=347529 RepID=A0AA38TU50_9ASTR|nr:LOW QUALITY PROTEIN: hypothetical protein OSB04_002135 [Centaurea solstitialis]